MKKLAALAASLAFLPALAGVAVGEKAPMTDRAMQGVDGSSLSIADAAGAKGTLVIFTCNHCPFVKAWLDRTVAAANAALGEGVGVIAINANDPAAYAEDSFEDMQKLAKEKGMKYPYVVDADSSVARAFGATRTPEFFLLDASGKVVYHGAFDDNARDPEKASDHYVKDAIEALVAGKEIPVKETKSIGCSIKFRGQS